MNISFILIIQTSLQKLNPPQKTSPVPFINSNIQTWAIIVLLCSKNLPLSKIILSIYFNIVIVN